MSALVWQPGFALIGMLDINTQLLQVRRLKQERTWLEGQIRGATGAKQAAMPAASTPVRHLSL